MITHPAHPDQGFPPSRPGPAAGQSDPWRYTRVRTTAEAAAEKVTARFSLVTETCWRPVPVTAPDPEGYRRPPIRIRY